MPETSGTSHTHYSSLLPLLFGQSPVAAAKSHSICDTQEMKADLGSMENSRRTGMLWNERAPKENSPSQPTGKSESIYPDFLLYTLWKMKFDMS